MNQWKHELNDIAGNFSEQQARLMQGVLTKSRKKKKRKTIFTTSIATILMAVIGLFLYQNVQPEQPTTASTPQKPQVEHQPLKFSTPDEPVYYDEKLYMFYTTIFQFGLPSVEEDLTVYDPDAMAFYSMISQQALEHQATLAGYKFDPTEYEKQIKEVRSTLTPELRKEFEEHAKASGLTIEEFVEQIALPVAAKTALLEQFLGDLDSLNQQITDFYEMYEAEIQALAAELKLEKKISNTWYNRMLGNETFEDVLKIEEQTE